MNYKAQSVQRGKVCDDNNLSVSDRYDSVHLNTTGSRYNRGKGVFWELRQALVSYIPFDSISLKKLYKSLAAIGIYQQVARQFKN